MSLVVGYTDEYSESLPALDGPCASFQKISCVFEFRVKDSRKTKAGDSRGRRHNNQSNLKKKHIPTSAIPEPHLSSKIRGPALVDALDTDNSTIRGSSSLAYLQDRLGCFSASHPRDPSASESSQSRTPFGSQPEAHTTFPGAAQETGNLHSDIPLLVSAALHKLLGTGRIVSGTRTTKSLMGLPLAKIAPAVWNVRYLQVRETGTTRCIYVEYC